MVTGFNKYKLSNIDVRKYFNKSNQINNIEAFIYNDLGVVLKKIKKSDFISQRVADGFLFFSDSRILFLNYTPVEYPFIIVFKSELESTNTAFLQNRHPIDDYFESVQKSTFSINHLSDLEFKSKESNFEIRAISKVDLPIKIVHSIQNVIAEKPEDGS